MARVRRKRYTTEFKAEAVRLVQTSDQRVTEIAEHLGVTAKTLHEWYARFGRRRRITHRRRAKRARAAPPRQCAVADGARHLKKSRGLLRARDERLTFRFIAAEKATFPIRPLCRALGVSASGYYAWAARARRPQPDRDLAVRHAIRVAHAESRGRYGSPRILQVLHARGHQVGRNRVIRLMRAEGLRARPRRRFVVTTDSRHRWAPAPNRLQRRFQTRRPNRC